MRNVVRVTAAAAALAVAAGVSGCQAAAEDTAPVEDLRLMVPAEPGGGWDLTARAAQQAMKAEGIAPNTEVYNVPAAGGIVGLSQLAEDTGNGDSAMVTGLVMLGAVEIAHSEVTLDDVTPIARLAEEYEVVVVPADSPYQDLGDLVRAWRANPGAVSFAGGSAGGTDQILAGLMAQRVGVDPRAVNYVAFSGGGASTAAILGGKVDAGISGYSEYAGQIESGEMRALGISAPRPVPGIDAPTLIQGGVDVSLENWRGIVAPPGLSEAQQQALIDVFARVRRSDTWQQVMRENFWRDDWLPGDRFGRYMDAEQKHVSAVLSDLGLT
jgi:putative tricarboxylic transport membrane protein